ncbi:MAG: anhydro-N-acetylmuramic acid kinase [Pseudomonadales bacterium]
MPAATDQGASRDLYLGAISGTSVDGLDLALLEIGPQIRVVAARTLALPRELQSTLLQLGQPGDGDLDDFGHADAALGAFIGAAALEFLHANGHSPEAITAIGSHGQTVRHRPGGTHPFSLQIGDPNHIAEITGITTVADFRRRDVAAGGQGAPLVPPFHAALFRTPEEDRAILNLGGIGNITLLPANPAAAVIGFDTGPGNALMDDWILLKRQQRYDASGAWAATGDVDDVLLTRLLTDPYLAAMPPKSTGREHYNLTWLNQQLSAHLEHRSVSDASVQATLCAFTAESVTRALARWSPGTERVLVCGGGRHNDTLMASLAARIPCAVEPTEAYGVDGDSLEAAAFAWLAQQTLNGQPGNAPSVTGARGSRVLGAVYPGCGGNRLAADQPAGC